MKVTWSKVNLVVIRDEVSLQKSFVFLYANKKQLENKIKNKTIFMFLGILCSWHWLQAKCQRTARAQVSSEEEVQGVPLGMTADQAAEGSEHWVRLAGPGQTCPRTALDERKGLR